MLCAISGEAPQVPVVSKKSGNVFEKSLIEAFIVEHGKDPITNEELSADDLVELRAARAIRPRPPQFTSIPSLLSSFQNEWDALALERFKLQQELEETRKELATALYQNDAAVRVLARVQKERDEARDALTKLSINGAAGESMQLDGQALPADLAQAVSETQATLSKTRRKRPVPDGWATADDVSAFKAQKLTDNAAPSSRFLAVAGDGDRLLHAAGQPTGSVAIFSVQQESNVEAIQSHQDSEVSAGIFAGEKSVAVGTKTGAIGILDGSNQLDISRIPHSAEVTSISLHPSSKFYASTSLDKSALFFRVDEAEPTGGIEVVSTIKAGTQLTAGSFHPDGHLFAAGGADGEVKIYATESGERAATFEVGGAVQTVDFSENGTWLATSVTGNNEIQIWDLRKSSIVHTLEAAGPISSVRWDYTGQFLAAATSVGISIFGYSKSDKKWIELVKSAAEATAIAWGGSAQKLFGTDAAGSIFEMV